MNFNRLPRRSFLRSLSLGASAPLLFPLLSRLIMLRQRKPVSVIASEVGLSRATVYRMLGRSRMKNRNRSGAETPSKAE